MSLFFSNQYSPAFCLPPIRGAILGGVLFGVVTLTGCATKTPMGLGAVGPAQVKPSASANGGLVVYTAYDGHADFDSMDGRLRYTDYKIYSEDGRLLQAVRNDSGSLVEGPRTVSLPPGKYRVTARANGYGTVKFEVVIAPRQTTLVHLEGSASWPNMAVLKNSDPVRLPNGAIVGWRAPMEEASQTSAAAKKSGELSAARQ
jgi:hypothetical protein